MALLFERLHTGSLGGIESEIQALPILLMGYNWFWTFLETEKNYSPQSSSEK
jgi:hypothetical protein